ncbi:MAG: 4-oxalocrotonate tautomerase family protein [Leptolyngbya sp. BL-A-14]
MPFVKILLDRTSLNAEQKQDLLQKVTNAMVAVEGEPLRQGIGVAITEVNSGEWVGSMPFTSITLIKAALSAIQRQTMLQNVTEAVVSVVGEDKRFGTWTVIEESVNDGEWSVGGKTLTIDALEQLKAGKNPW